jgi:hypothetical protein
MDQSVWGLDFGQASGNMGSRSTKILALNSHAGFTVLADLDYIASGADQTLLAIRHTSSAFSLTIKADGAWGGFSFSLTTTAGKPPLELATETTDNGRHLMAFRYNSFSNSIQIFSVARNGTLSTLAAVRTDLAEEILTFATYKVALLVASGDSSRTSLPPHELHSWRIRCADFSWWECTKEPSDRRHSRRKGCVDQ